MAAGNLVRFIPAVIELAQGAAFTTTFYDGFNGGVGDNERRELHERAVLHMYPTPRSQATLKTIACGSGGIFQAIPDGGSLSTAMSGYYRSVVKDAQKRD